MAARFSPEKTLVRVDVDENDAFHRVNLLLFINVILVNLLFSVEFRYFLDSKNHNTVIFLSNEK